MVFFIIINGRMLLPTQKTFSLSELKCLKQFFMYSFYSWPVPILLYLNVVLTQIIIRAKLGNDAVGIFTSVSIFLGIITVVQAGFSTYWSGFMFKHYRSQTDLIIQMHDYLSLFTIVIMVTFVFSRDVIFSLIGVNYHASKPLFALLLINPLLLILSETTGYGISIAQKSYLMLFATSVSILINISMIWLLIPLFGLVGASIGSAVSGVVLFVLQTYFAQKHYKSIQNIRKTSFAVVSLIVIAVGNLIYSKSSYEIACLIVLIFIASMIVYWKQVYNSGKTIIRFKKGVLPEGT